MKRIATMMALALLVGAMNIASAQEREDIIWARDIGSAEITLDGMLDESVWSQAETINLVWGERGGLPGSGWRIHESGGVTPGVAEPTDPIDATISILRKDNQLYIGVTAQDKSIGGFNGGLWNIDGFVMAMQNKANYIEQAATMPRNLFPGAGTAEFIYSWWHQADTTNEGLSTPGADPRFHGTFGSPNNERSKERTPEQVAAWDAVTVVEGTTNDDTHGDDTGYTMEMRIDLTELGFDATQAGGDVIPASFTIYDADYLWPLDLDQVITTKTWFQSQWGNNLNEGAALIYAQPGVTVDTAVLPEPPSGDFTVPANELFDTPEIDGVLDDDVWVRVEPQVQFGYQQTDVNETLPGFGKWYTFWFRPDLNGAEDDPPVVDPSVIRLKFFHEGSRLFIGADIDDQAISGLEGESGDGFRITINHVDSLDGDNTPFPYQFIFNVDSTGAVRLSGEAGVVAMENPDAIQAAASLKGSSTPADPTDVDEGYQIEIMIDLEEALGYPTGLGGMRYVWMGANLFDGDYLEDSANDYRTVTWWLRERNTGPGAVAFLDPNEVVGTAIDDGLEVPDGFALKGNYPNPFNPSTTLNYTLSRAGNVTLFVYDVLGRRVAEQVLGAQAAGEQRVAFDGKNLSSGVYFYRLQVQGADKSAFLSPVGRMVLLK